jgi:hypothetical protein
MVSSEQVEYLNQLFQTFSPHLSPFLPTIDRRKTRSDDLIVLPHFRSKSRLRQTFRSISMVEMGGLEPPTPCMRSKSDNDDCVRN